MRFLIFGGPGIGDTIFELSLAKALKSGYPDSQIDLIVSDTLGAKAVVDSVLSCQDYITECYRYSKNELRQTFGTLLKLRANKYDYSFACAAAFKANDTASRISRIIGCKSIIKEVKGKTGKIDIPVEVDESLHFAEQYQELCKQLLPDRKLDVLVLDPDKAADFQIPTKRDKLVTICLGTNITIYRKDGKIIEKNIKDYGTDRWIKVANELDSRGCGVALIGGKKEAEELNSAAGTLSGSVMNYVGRTSVQESLGIIKKSDIVVGADTGMMHCAAALDVKTLTLFGGTDANIWRPYSPKGTVLTGTADCSPCYGKEYAIECKERKCMKNIPVKAVYEKAMEIIGVCYENKTDQ